MNKENLFKWQFTVFFSDGCKVVMGRNKSLSWCHTLKEAFKESPFNDGNCEVVISPVGGWKEAEDPVAALVAAAVARDIPAHVAVAQIKEVLT